MILTSQTARHKAATIQGDGSNRYANGFGASARVGAERNLLNIEKRN